MTQTRLYYRLFSVVLIGVMFCFALSFVLLCDETRPAGVFDPEKGLMDQPSRRVIPFSIAPGAGGAIFLILGIILLDEIKKEE